MNGVELSEAEQKPRRDAILAHQLEIRTWEGGSFDEYNESTGEENSDRDHYGGSPWVSEENTNGYLDGDEEVIVDQMGHYWRMLMITAG